MFWQTKNLSTERWDLLGCHFPFSKLARRVRKVPDGQFSFMAQWVKVRHGETWRDVPLKMVLFEKERGPVWSRVALRSTDGLFHLFHP